jgi:MoaA/NifB/PqqE/SkfB family radical SAM enzyme
MPALAQSTVRARLIRHVQRLAKNVDRRIGRYFPDRLRVVVREALFKSTKALELHIDVVGGCNLRCPSCAVGNMGLINPTGLLEPEHLARIVKKAATEYRISVVLLFNWAEPFLHPKLPELIQIVRDEGLKVALSTNLNFVRRIDDVMIAGPDFIRVSLSGFTQETYGRTHARGQIEKVKTNMRLLAEAKQRVGNTRTQVQVFYHKYRDNLHEVELMRQYASELGFAWLEHWAYFLPLEKVLDLADGNLGAKDREFVEDAFALPIKEALDVAKAFGPHECPTYSRQIVLDVKGDLKLCCGTYDTSRNGGLGSFVDMTPEDVWRAKSNHPTCTKCMDEGVHLYATFPEFPELAAKYDELVKINLARSRRPKRTLPIAD